MLIDDFVHGGICLFIVKYDYYRLGFVLIMVNIPVYLAFFAQHLVPYNLVIVFDIYGDVFLDLPYVKELVYLLASSHFMCYC